MRHTEVFTGRVGQIRDLIELANDNCLISFSVAETPRVKNQDGSWGDGVTVWTDVTIFGDMARNFKRSAIKPGTFVTVIGTRNAREWTPKDSNEKRISQNIVADQVSVALTRWHYVTGVENVGGNKGGGQQTQTQNQTQASTTSTSAQQDPFGGASSGGGSSDPFADDNPFGGGDDDPFNLG